MRWRHRLGWPGISLLMLPILFWVWMPAHDPLISVLNGAVPGDVLSGRLFTDKFDTVHAGFSLDQPTIGKWLFWFTVMTVSSLPWAAAVRWLSDRTTRSGYWAYGACVGILALLLLCILTWPLSWLIQYVCSMGFTPRRAYGLLYAVSGASLVIGFLAWSFRSTKAAGGETACICRQCGYDLRGTTAAGRAACPECGTPIETERPSISA